MGKRLQAILFIALAPIVLAPSVAGAESLADESFRLVNQERTSRGLAALRWSSAAADVARRHSNEMSSQGDLHHNENLANEIDGWSSIGENVGTGDTVGDVHDMFMGSATHRSNILDRTFTHVGIGVTTDGDGRVWVTQDFFTPQRTSTASSSTSTTTTRRRTTVRRPRPAQTRAPSRSTPPSPSPRPAPSPTPPREPEPTPVWQRNFGNYMPFSR